MLKHLDRAWRILATGIAFSLFGVGGLLLRVVYFPLLRCAVWSRERRARLSRLSIHYSFRVFVETMRCLGILRYRIVGADRLKRAGLLILANHPTLIDVVFLISLVPNADCVVKASLARNPFMRGPIDACNYIFNDSGAGLVDDCIESLNAGGNLIIFPEGTRTPLCGEMKLQRGAANIAVRGPVNVTPVIIRCEPIALSKGVPWWRVAERRMLFSIEVREDIPITPFIEQAEGEPALAARSLTDYLHTYFSTEHMPHAGARA